MFNIKTYKNIKNAICEAKRWLKEKLPHGYFDLQVPENSMAGSEDFGYTKDALDWIEDCFQELDQREGEVGCYQTAGKGTKWFDFIETPTEDDIKSHEEFERRYSIFEEAGGQRELFIKDKETYWLDHCMWADAEKSDLQERRKSPQFAK